MTAVIHHGPPGSYKSFAIVQDVVIPALKQGRTVISNIRGLDDIPRICEAMKITVPDSAQLVSVKHDSQEGFEHMARFFQWAPMGSLIVMDEGQRVYPTRLKSLSVFDTPEDEREQLDNGIQRPFTVENAFDQHRHMNWDIYISTTNIGKIHKEVRAVAEYGFRHRDLTGVLPWLKNCWREFKHDPEASGKSVSHYIGAPVRKKADKRIFKCYQSTATGTAKGSNENKSVFSDPKLRVFMLIFVLAVGHLVSRVFEGFDRFEEVDAVAVQDDWQAVADAVDSHSDVEPSPAPVARVDRVDSAAVEIFAGRKLFYTGTVSGSSLVHYFDLIGKDDYISLTSSDLEAAGFAVVRISDCVVRVWSAKFSKFAVCAPDKLEREVRPQLLAQTPG